MLPSAGAFAAAADALGISPDEQVILFTALWKGGQLILHHSAKASSCYLHLCEYIEDCNDVS